MDDTLVIRPHGAEEKQIFVTHHNSFREAILFTMEIESEGTIPLLDVLVI
jgi:hypothetical protein